MEEAVHTPVEYDEAKEGEKRPCGGGGKIQRVMLLEAERGRQREKGKEKTESEKRKGERKRKRKTKRKRQNVAPDRVLVRCEVERVPIKWGYDKK